MINIALCDTNKRHLMEIQSVLTGILFDRVDFDICLYQNGIDLVEAIRTKRFYSDLVIMDIEMKPINGLNIANLIRSNRIKCDIIFLTSSGEYVFEGYKYSVLDYIVKPVSISRLQRTLDRYIKEKEYSTEYFYFKTGSSYNKVDLSKVEAFVNSGRKITTVSQGEEVSFYKKVDEIEENPVIKKLFIRTHQSFLVNMKHIKLFDSEKVVLTSGYEVPIAKRRYPEASKKFIGFAESNGYIL